MVGILERVKAEVEHRQQFIAELNSQDGKMGRTAADLNYRPLVLLVDEIGAILATMAPKSQKEMIESLVAIYHERAVCWCSCSSGNARPFD